MAGLVPAIHALALGEDVDARHKAGHDGGGDNASHQRCISMRSASRAARPNIHLQGWLLALPAVVLLATFTHIPAISTVIDSLFSTPHGRQAARFLGLGQYRTMLAALRHRSMIQRDGA